MSDGTMVKSSGGLCRLAAVLLFSLAVLGLGQVSPGTGEAPADALEGFPDEDELSEGDLEAANPNEGEPINVASDIALETGAELEEREEGERQFEIAECTFDAGLAVFYLMRAGLEINGASESCPEDEKNECTMEVSGVVASFSDSATFLSGVADTCPPQEGTVQMKCAAAITKLIGATGEIVAAAAGMAEQCNPEDLAQTDEDIKKGEVVQRRLEEHDEGEKEEEEEEGENRPAEIAECVCDTSSATFLLGYAGLEITASTKNCPMTKDGKGYQQACAAQVSGALASFGFTATYLSAAAAECGQSANAHAECAADITKLVASLSEIASAASGMAKVCVQSALRGEGEGGEGGEGGESGEPGGEGVTPPYWIVAMENNAPLAANQSLGGNTALPAVDVPLDSFDARREELLNGRRLSKDDAQSALIDEERAILLSLLSSGGVWGHEQKRMWHAMVKKHGLEKHMTSSKVSLRAKANEMSMLHGKWRAKLKAMKAKAAKKSGSAFPKKTSRNIRSPTNVAPLVFQ